MDYEGNANLMIVAVALGMGVLPIAVPDFYEEFPAWFGTIFESGISAAAVTAVLLNLLFNVAGKEADEEGPIVAEAPPPGVTPNYDHSGGCPAEASLVGWAVVLLAATIAPLYGRMQPPGRPCAASEEGLP